MMRRLILTTFIVTLAACSQKTEPSATSAATASGSLPGVGSVAAAKSSCAPWPSAGYTVASAQSNSDGSPRKLRDAPKDLPGKTLVLRYSDFGPSAMATKLLGVSWWSWAQGGCYGKTDSFDVRVVVYQGIEIDAVKKRFPTVPGQSDYRLIPYASARAYLDEQIAAIADTDGPGLQNLRSELGDTRFRLAAALAPKAMQPKR